MTSNQPEVLVCTTCIRRANEGFHLSCAEDLRTNITCGPCKTWKLDCRKIPDHTAIPWAEELFQAYHEIHVRDPNPEDRAVLKARMDDLQQKVLSHFDTAAAQFQPSNHMIEFVNVLNGYLREIDREYVSIDTRLDRIEQQSASQGPSSNLSGPSSNSQAAEHNGVDRVNGVGEIDRERGINRGNGIGEDGGIHGISGVHSVVDEDDEDEN